MYLAAAGIGRLGIVDYDTVELSNLHRQVIHGEDRVNQSKAESAAKTLKQINGECAVETFVTLLSRSNAIEIIEKFDVVVDASDNAVTRYLINDVCVLLGKPLVSGAAIRFEGQLTTYNFQGSPCYRCIYPVPPAASLVVNCDAGGVLGPVTGTIGSLQALEVIRIISMNESNYAGKLLIFNGIGGMFRTLKLRPRSSGCMVCGENPTITRDLINYEMFCDSTADDKTPSISILDPVHRIDPVEFEKIRTSVAIIDVRPAVQFDICRFPNSLNAPFESLRNHLPEISSFAQDKEVVVICRRGNDSQLAVNELKQAGMTHVKDLIGGLLKYADQVDPTIPKY